MRIAFISHSASIAGAERALLELLPGLPAYGITPVVVLPSEGVLERDLERAGIEYIVVPFGWWAFPSWAGDASSRPGLEVHEEEARQLANALRPLALDGIYSNTSVICAGALAARSLGVPHLWHIHELNPYVLDPADWPVDRPHLALDLGLVRSLALIDRLSACCVLTSKAMGRAYAPYFSRRRRKVLYQSVTLDLLDPAAEAPKAALPARAPGRFRAAIIATLAEWKRQEDAVRALAVLLENGAEAELLVVGRAADERYAEQLRELSIRLGLEDRTWFLDGADPVAVIRGADCVLNCSRAEAFGRVTVEAMQLGKPVIGSASGANPELIRHGRTGLLYPVLEYRALAERMRLLARRTEHGLRIGARAQRWVKRRFSRSRYTRQMAKVIGSAVGL